MKHVRYYWISLLLVTLCSSIVLLISRDVGATDNAEDNYSTPQLIDAAFAKGDITADERILYMAYAIYEHESLPAQYEGTVGWYGSQAVREINQAYINQRGSFAPTIQRELDRLLNNVAATICNKEDESNSTTSTNFYYNYGTIGGGLSITDYTTSMEAAFTKIVTDYGWAKPPLCTAADVTEGGCNNANLLGGTGLFPVQVNPIGASLFGYVTANLGDGLYTGVVADNPNTAAVETDASASCMVLNDDFSQFSGNTAQENLDATTSHEYVHAVQNAYGDPFTAGVYEDAMWYESVAAYFEDEMSDTANSANGYLWPVTTNCLGHWPDDADPGDISQYSNFMFFRHVAENTGGANAAGGGEDTIQQLWANIGTSQIGLDAMNSALVSANPSTNLNDAFHNYAIAVKHSKACGAGYAAPYCFEEGAQYVASNGTLPPDQGAISANPGTYTGSISEHYAINYVSLPSMGSYNVKLTNTATSGLGQLRGSVVCDTGASFTITPLSTVVGNGQDANMDINSAACTAGVTLVITNQGTTPGTEPASCTATPYSVMLQDPTAVTLSSSSVSSLFSGMWALSLIAFALLLSMTYILVSRYQQSKKEFK